MIDDYLVRTDGYAPTGKSRGSLLLLALGLVVALVLGGALAVWGGERLGWLDLKGGSPAARPAISPVRAAAPMPEAMAAEDAQAALGLRVGELEQRLTRLGIQAEEASGNAARAEGLLIAFAARRAVERGQRLGYLEDQLRLRFGDAQPNAVQALIEAAAQPVTNDALVEGLRALEPTLVGTPRDANAWDRIRGELAQLFVVRRVNAPSAAPERRLERARLLLESGRIDAAIGEVGRLPNRTAARNWIALAQRHARAQRALDLIETAAILEPRRLQDDSGAPVETPSPLAPPAGARL